MKKITQRQKDILFWISDAVHNIGTEMYKENSVHDENDFLKTIGSIFASTRTLTSNIEKGFYSDEEFNEILDFIKNDFNAFCHYRTDTLDINKYWSMISNYMQ